ncbi:MAG: hypothetical protein JOZ02_13100 [Acidobacteria bacterium]|nr:hypothetical protein [Acidobacteriota bacterium]
MSMKDNLQKARKAINNDPTAIGVAKELREAAIEVITHGGIESELGRKYMALFCDTKNELARLTVASDSDANYMPRVRAYTAADAICIPETGAGFAARILSPDIVLEPVADEEVPADMKEPSTIRDVALFQKLQQG